MANSSKSVIDSQFDIIPPPTESAEERNHYFDQTAVNRNFDDVIPITENEVRNALRNEAKNHKYWKANVAKKMTIENIENSSCLHYSLESYTEMRSTSKGMEGVTLGQFIQQQGSALSSSKTNADFNPWSYPVEQPESFVEHVKIFEMPGTSELVSCHSCNAEGLTHCFYCRGYGTDKCTYCRGTGMKAGVAHPAIYTHPMVAAFPHSDLCRGYPGSGTAVVRPTSGGLAYGIGTPIHFMARAGVPPPGIGHHDLCHFCQGRGIRDCTYCKGHGKKPCSACGGSGSMREFVKLRVHFAIQRDNYYSACQIPEKFLATVGGQIIMNECQKNVVPIKKHPLDEINEVSRQLCTSHFEDCLGKCRINKQRHYLEAIPIAKVKYRFGSRDGFFWIYGAERKCYFPNYPSKCSLL